MIEILMLEARSVTAGRKPGLPSRSQKVTLDFHVCRGKALEAQACSYIGYGFSNPKGEAARAGLMAQWLGVLLAEGPYLNPSTHMRQHASACNFRVV